GSAASCGHRIASTDTFVDAATHVGRVDVFLVNGLAGSNRDGSSRTGYLMLNRLVYLFLFTAPLAAAEIPLSSFGLDLGFRQMYNLQFAQAHKTFAEWNQLNPKDPMGYVSDAAAYLFAEFDRLHILQSELFVEDSKFLAQDKRT